METDIKIIMEHLKRRFIEIEKVAGQERFRDWFLSAIETYKPGNHSQDELRKHVAEHIEQQYKDYQEDIAYRIMTSNGCEEE